MTRAAAHVTLRSEGSDISLKVTGIAIEVPLNAFAIEWVFRLSQNYRIDDVMAGNLGGQKCSPCGKVYVGKFHQLIA
jgi:hypothetical protein